MNICASFFLNFGFVVPAVTCEDAQPVKKQAQSCSKCSEDLNTGLFWYSNGQSCLIAKWFGIQMPFE